MNSGYPLLIFMIVGALSGIVACSYMFKLIKAKYALKASRGDDAAKELMDKPNIILKSAAFHTSIAVMLATILWNFLEIPLNNSVAFSVFVGAWFRYALGAKDEKALT
jgi:hypothetical protein